MPKLYDEIWQTGGISRQKHEEKNNAVCESFRLQGERKGYYGYVPAVGKAAIRMKITFILCHCFVHLLIDV